MDRIALLLSIGVVIGCGSDGGPEPGQPEPRPGGVEEPRSESPPAEPGRSESDELPTGLPIEPTFAYDADVVETGTGTIDVSGIRYFDFEAAMTYIEVETAFQPDEATDISEGFYLGYAAPTANEIGLLGKSIAFRAELNEVTAPDAARLTVGDEAAKRMAKGWVVRLRRPLGTTTATMRAIPDVAELDDRQERILGLDNETSARFVAAKNQLKQLGLAIHNFHESHGILPPAAIIGPDGKPWHSWRVLLLPYLEEFELYDEYRFDEPWDGPNNKKLLDRMPEWYRDPARSDEDPSHAHVVAVAGPKTAFVTAKFSVEQPPRQFNARSLSGAIGFRDVTDGTVNTLALGYVAAGRDIPWTKPEDVVHPDESAIGSERGFAMPFVSRERGKGGAFVMLDGSVHALRNELDAETWSQFLERNDGNIVDFDSGLLSPDQEEYEYSRKAAVDFERTETGYRAVVRSTFDPEP